MSLDDAISAARSQAQRRAEVQRQEHEQRKRQQAEQQQLLAEAVPRLQPYGNDEFVQVQRPARWFHLNTYRDPEGAQYRVVSSQRCWVVCTYSEGPLTGSILLLEDGTLGCHWPEQLTSDVGAAARYVSSGALDTVVARHIAGATETFVEALQRRLGEAIVFYERFPAQHS